ncbi:MAG: plastocyanin/azurin family copper-binding protein [Thermoplasmata archaeon]|nr:plastocyanin/azurin family copper-binding protein [Thermoplasmata archaeon]
MTDPTRTAPIARRLRRAAAALGVVSCIVMALGLVAAAPVSAAMAQSNAIGYGHLSSAPGSVSFNVSMNDTPAFNPGNLTGAPSGSTVTLNLSNKGLYNHTFTLSKVANFQIPRGWTPAQLQSWFAANGSLVNVSVLPGASTTATFVVPNNTAGYTFEYVSLVPYQFQAGMLGVFTVLAGPGTVVQEQATADIRFVPDVLQVNATTYPIVVDVAVTDVGGVGHTFTISALANVTVSAANYSTYFQAHALSSVSVGPGSGPYWANFTIDHAGTYEYVCLIPGHFAAGMFGTLYVGVAPPAAAAPLSSAIVQAGVLLAGGILLAIAVVLVLAATWAGRFAPPTTPKHH